MQEDEEEVKPSEVEVLRERIERAGKILQPLNADGRVRRAIIVLGLEVVEQEDEKDGSR